MDAGQTPSETTSPTIRLDSARGRWIIAATSLGSGMIFLDGTVVNVALPRIQADFSASLAGLQWIVNAYTLFLAALLMLGGAMGDAYGRKIAFSLGLILFTLASVGCALAPSLGVLIAARAVQGVGGALLVPGSLAMIKAVIRPADSGRAIGLWAGLAGVTAAIGPFLGGYLVGAVSWRAIFIINAPVAVLTLIATRHIPPNRDEDAPPSLDWLGALATVMGLGGLTFVLIQAPQSGILNPVVLACLAVGLLGVVAFPLREARARHPMVPLGTFRSRNFTGANLATLGVYFCLSGVLLFLVLDLQQIQGYSPIQAGVSLLPFTILLLLLSPRVGGLQNRLGIRSMMTLGPVLVAAGFVLLMLSGREVVYWRDVLPGVICIGLGMSLFITPLVTTVMDSVAPSLVGVASGVNNTLSRVASLLAIAILGIVIVARFGSTLDTRLHASGISPGVRSALLAHTDRLADDPLPAGLRQGERIYLQKAIQDAYIDGFRWAMGTCVLICLASSMVSFVTIKPPD